MNTNKDVSLCRQILLDDNEVYDYSCTKQNSFLSFKQWLHKCQHPKFIECRLNRAYPAVLLTQVSDTTQSMIGYKYLLAAV